MAKKSTPAERRALIEQMRKDDARGFDPTKGRFRNMSFIDRYGDVVLPSQDYPGKRKPYQSDQPSYDDGRRFRRNYGFIALVGLLGSIFFLSSNLTGKVVADLTIQTSSFLGASLLIVGLIAGFLFFKNRKKN